MSDNRDKNLVIVGQQEVAASETIYVDNSRRPSPWRILLALLLLLLVGAAILLALDLRDGRFDMNPNPVVSAPADTVALSAEGWRGAGVAAGCMADADAVTTEQAQAATGIEGLVRNASKGCAWSYASNVSVTVPALGPDWVFFDYSQGLVRAVQMTQEQTGNNFEIAFAPGYGTDISAQDLAAAQAEQISAVAQADAVDSVPLASQVQQALGNTNIPLRRNEAEIGAFFAGPNGDWTFNVPAGYLVTFDPVGDSSPEVVLGPSNNHRGTAMTVRVIVQEYLDETEATSPFPATAAGFGCLVWHKESANGFVERPQFEVINKVPGCVFNRDFATSLIRAAGSNEELPDNGFYVVSQSVLPSVTLTQAWNLRASASQTSALLGTIPAGTQVFYTSFSNSWCEIRKSDNMSIAFNFTTGYFFCESELR